jgi:hypothetical protein
VGRLLLQGFQERAMPSIFDALFSAFAAPLLADILQDEDAVTYTAKDGSETTFDAIIGSLELKRRLNKQTGALDNYRTRTITVRTAELARSSIATNGTMTIDSRKYSIEHIGDDSAGQYDVQLEELRPGEITREKYRERRR